MESRHDRSELLALIAALGEHELDLCFGQLVANRAFLARPEERDSMWNVEDAELAETLRRHLESRWKRAAVPVAFGRASWA
jgi:hypothetical protein